MNFLVFALLHGTVGFDSDDIHAALQHIQVGPVDLDIGVDLRLRSELQNNFTIKRYERTRDALLLERARIDVGARLEDGPRFFVQGQDARELGSNLGDEDFETGSPFCNHLDLREAFLEWERISGTPIGFKAGRQVIAFTDGRLMGPGDWGNVGRYVWDAVRLTWRSKLAEADLFYARRVQYGPRGFDSAHFPYHALGLFSTIPLRGSSLSKAYGITERFSQDIDVRVRTVSPLTRGQRSKLKKEVTVALNTAGFTVDHERDAWGEDENRKMGHRAHYAPIMRHILEPTVKLETVTYPLRHRPTPHAVASLVAKTTGAKPEIESMPCVALEETCADKLVALVRRLSTAIRTDDLEGQRDVVRHLYDLERARDQLDLGLFAGQVADVLVAEARQWGRRSPHFVADPQHEAQVVLGALREGGPLRDAFDSYQRSFVYGTLVHYDDAVSTVADLSKYIHREHQRSRTLEHDPGERSL